MQDQYDQSYIERHFQDYCRCCLKNNEGKVNKYKRFLENIKLASDFLATFGVDITDREILPSNVCLQCYKMLAKIFEFRKTCLSTHQRLTEIKQNMPVMVKDEFFEPVMVNIIETFEDEQLPSPKISEIKQENGDASMVVDLKIEAMPSKCESDDDGDEDVEEPVVKKSKCVRKSTGDKPKSKRRRVQCPECGSFVQNIKEHARIHEANPYICHFCDRRVTMKINMLQHLKVHFKIRDHECPDCQRTFSSSSAVRRHSVIHSDTRKHKCDLCDKWYKSVGVLNQHKKIVHFKQAIIICEICDTERRFYSKTHYETHKRNVHATPAKCVVCSYVLKNEKNLAKHMLTHGVGYENTQPEFKCPICGKVCSRNNAFLSHMKCHARPEGRCHKDSMKLAGSPQFTSRKRTQN